PPDREEGSSRTLGSTRSPIEHDGAGEAAGATVAMSRQRDSYRGDGGRAPVNSMPRSEQMPPSDDYSIDGAEPVRRPPLSGQLPPSRQAAGPSRPLLQAIQHKLGADEERESQRRKLVSILIIAQLLLTLAVALGYVVPEVRLTLLPLLIAALVIYGIAFLMNRLLNNGTLATYILVFGGALVVTAQVAVAALAS